MPKRRFTAAVHREGDLYVALCPELDVASQGRTVEKARSNLAEAVRLFLETANPPRSGACGRRRKPCRIM
jgi:predicted RNase H-like HicB family nuclease